jgi:hypothetical protein
MSKPLECCGHTRALHGPTGCVEIVRPHPGQHAVFCSCRAHLSHQPGAPSPEWIDQNSTSCDACQHEFIDFTALKTGEVPHSTAGDPEGEGSGCAFCMHADAELLERMTGEEFREIRRRLDAVAPKIERMRQALELILKLPLTVTVKGSTVPMPLDRAQALARTALDQMAAIPPNSVAPAPVEPLDSGGAFRPEEVKARLERAEILLGKFAHFRFGHEGPCSTDEQKRKAYQEAADFLGLDEIRKRS